MSKQGVNAVLDRLDADADFRRRLKEASTPAEKEELLGDVGAGEAEIADEELDKIAGGVTDAAGFSAGVDRVGAATILGSSS